MHHANVNLDEAAPKDRRGDRVNLIVADTGDDPVRSDA